MGKNKINTKALRTVKFDWQNKIIWKLMSYFDLNKIK
jgi:hypothetical protein